MIVQITATKDECFLIKELLPVWQNYTDGFVFMVDKSTTDDTVEYLQKNKEKYNILEIIEHDWDSANPDERETYARQKMFDVAYKYSNKIICLDTDEYLDGTLSKKELDRKLESETNTLFLLRWVQYTNKNEIRVDGPWANNFKDRLGSFSYNAQFSKRHNHSLHLPNLQKDTSDPQISFKHINPSELFIAHLQWLDKKSVGIKQYYWKVCDYVQHKLHNVEIINCKDYDGSINNFIWTTVEFNFPLKIKDTIYKTQNVRENTKLKYIKEQTKKHNIPNLGDWGMGIFEYASALQTNTTDKKKSKMYFCTAADSDHFNAVINLIGSIHKYNYNQTEEIAVFDLGLNPNQIEQLKRIKKINICQVEQKNPLITTSLYNGNNRWIKGLFSWKPVVIKQSLQMFPHVLYADAGTTFQKPIESLFEHILSEKYFLTYCGHSSKWMTTKHVIDKLALTEPGNAWILNDNTLGIDAGFMGLTKEMEKTFLDPVYELCDDIHNFLDDATCPEGWGTARHDQTLFSIQAQKMRLNILKHDRPVEECILLPNTKKIPFHITHSSNKVKPDTYVFRCRRFVSPEIFNENIKYIQQKF